MLGILQEYLLGVVDDAGCKPYGCVENSDRIRVDNSYLARLPQPLIHRGAIARARIFFWTSHPRKAAVPPLGPVWPLARILSPGVRLEHPPP